MRLTHLPGAFGALLLALILLPSAPAFASQPFSDVPSTYWAATAIDAMAAQGILEGVGGGLFDPNLPISRQEFATILVRAAGLTPADQGPPFTDVTGGYYLPYIETATGDGLMEPVGPYTFAPTVTLTRLQAADGIIHFLGLQRLAPDFNGASLPYTDASQIPAAQVGEVKVLTDLGVFNGSGGQFLPTSPLTRAELAAIVYRALGVTPAQIAQESALVAANVSVPQDRVVNVGQSVPLFAYVHDSVGNLLPAPVSFTATAGQIQGQTYVATVGGNQTVTAQVAGGSAKGSFGVTVEVPQALSLSTPQTVNQATPVPTVVTVTDSNGGQDPADSGRQITLTVSGPAAQTLTVQDQSGSATTTVTYPSPGTYTLVASSSGLESSTDTITVLGPVAGALSIASLPGSAPAGASLPITVNSTATIPVPVAIQVSGPASFTATTGTANPGSTQVGTLTMTGIGQVTLTVSAPGGAASGSTASISAVSAGTLVPSQSQYTITAGSQGVVTFTVEGAPGDPTGLPVSLTPVAQDGSLGVEHQGTISGGSVSFDVFPTRAGTYQLQVTAPDFTLGQMPTLVVTAGAVKSFAATFAPTSVLPDGSSATLQVALVDAYGNPVSTPLSVSVQEEGSAAGTWAPGATNLSGPGSAGTFTATQSSGTTTFVVSSPQDPTATPQTLIVRDVPAGIAGSLSGQGMWLPYFIWTKTPDQVILQRALAEHATSIYLEVATSNDAGFYGGPGLDDLVQKAHQDGIALYAWVFPNLQNVPADIAFTQSVLGYVSPLGAKPDGLAMDIETNMSPGAVSQYAQAVRQAAGPNTLLIAVTYPPQQRPNYPYAQLGPYVNAFAPMDYWHGHMNNMTYNQVFNYIQTSVETIRAQDGNSATPIAPILQTFDLFYTQGPYNPTYHELEGAIAGAQASGALGVSYYHIMTITPQELQAISDFQFGTMPLNATIAP